MVDDNIMKYARVVEPLVEKPTEEMQPTDYKFSKIKLSKQTHLGCKQDALPR